MSDWRVRSEFTSRPLVAATSGGSQFRSDARYAIIDAVADQTLTEPRLAEPRSNSPELPDPVALAWVQGHAAGLAEADTRIATHCAGEDAVHAQLALAFARLDATHEDQLRERLRDTVAALCEATLAPLALDEAALLRRVERAAAMLARADDDRIIRLHPADLAVVSRGGTANWVLQPDPRLERGAVRVEGSAGGVEDGPRQWRRAIAEALEGC